MPNNISKENNSKKISQNLPKFVRAIIRNKDNEFLQIKIRFARKL
jgi:hypothetical protein